MTDQCKIVCFKDTTTHTSKDNKMKTKILAFTLLAIFLGACDCNKNKSKADKMGLICINGYVFKERNYVDWLGAIKMELTPLNIECPSGKVEVN